MSKKRGKKAARSSAGAKSGIEPAPKTPESNADAEPSLPGKNSSPTKMPIKEAGKASELSRSDAPLQQASPVQYLAILGIFGVVIFCGLAPFFFMSRFRNDAALIFLVGIAMFLFLCLTALADYGLDRLLNRRSD